jgi:WhiB family redox-sensing transcriptional regulator
VADNWRLRAACKDEDPELFFPRATGGKWSARYQEQVNTAKAVCRECPVADLCFEFAMDTHAEGVWAATTDDDRKAMREEVAA